MFELFMSGLSVVLFIIVTFLFGSLMYALYLLWPVILALLQQMKYDRDMFLTDKEEVTAEDLRKIKKKLQDLKRRESGK